MIPSTTVSSSSTYSLLQLRSAAAYGSSKAVNPTMAREPAYGIRITMLGVVASGRRTALKMRVFQSLFNIFAVVRLVPLQRFSGNVDILADLLDLPITAGECCLRDSP